MKKILGSYLDKCIDHVDKHSQINTTSQLHFDLITKLRNLNYVTPEQQICYDHAIKRLMMHNL